MTPHNHASKQDIDELKNQTVQLNSKLGQFQKLIQDLKISVSEKDVEIFRLNLALGDQRKRSNTLNSQLRDPQSSAQKLNRRNNEFMSSINMQNINNPIGNNSSNNIFPSHGVGNDSQGLGGANHSRQQSSRTIHQFKNNPQKPETREIQAQTDNQAYERGLLFMQLNEAQFQDCSLNQHISNLQIQNKQLIFQLAQQRQVTASQRTAYQKQIESDRNATNKNVQSLETKINDLTIEHSSLLQQMRKQKNQWMSQRKNYERQLLDKSKSISQMQKRIAKHQRQVQKALKIHKVNKELGSNNIKLKEDIKISKERWEKRNNEQISKIQHLEKTISTLKQTFRTSDSKVCGQCAQHLDEKEQIQKLFNQRSSEIDIKKGDYQKQLQVMLENQKQLDEKLKNQPGKIEEKMLEIQNLIQEERSKKREYGEQIKETGKEISEKDEMLEKMQIEYEEAKQEFQRYELKDSQNQITIDQAMNRVAEVNAKVEQQRKTHGRLKQQLEKDASSIIQMLNNEQKLSGLIFSSKNEIQELEGLLPKKKK